MKKIRFAALAVLIASTAACHGGKGANSPGEEDDAVVAVRKRAAFDLDCPEQQIKVVQLQEGGMMTAASYGASCGDKHASYIERMGTVIKQ